MKFKQFVLLRLRNKKNGSSVSEPEGKKKIFVFF